MSTAFNGHAFIQFEFCKNLIIYIWIICLYGNKCCWWLTEYVCNIIYFHQCLWNCLLFFLNRKRTSQNSLHAAGWHFHCWITSLLTQNMDKWKRQAGLSLKMLRAKPCVWFDNDRMGVRDKEMRGKRSTFASTVSQPTTISLFFLVLFVFIDMVTT